jgi:chemotaxis protein MotB
MRRRRPDRSGEAAPTGAPAWMVTYGDLVTQILAFFVLLYSFSSLNEQKFRETLASLQDAFGNQAQAAATGPVSNGNPAAPAAPLRNASLLTIQKQMASALKDRDAQSVVRFEGKDQLLIIHFDATALFDSGRAELKQGALPALDAVAVVLGQVPNQIRVEGHTDSDPMIPNPIYPDNWMLSGARATGVLRYLHEFHQITYERMSIAGYADTRPVASNETPEGKAKNRRVDIVVVGK